MGKSKVSRRKQKMYNMKGCSKTRKSYLGGSPDVPLAYTGQPVKSVSNPFLAYTGKGGSNCGLSTPLNIPINTNAANPAYPNTGAPIKPNTIYNDAQNSQSGGCGCGLPIMTGGKTRKGGYGPLRSMGFMVGGTRHRAGCKCSKCKKRVMKGGNLYPNGLVPNGLVGSPFKPESISGLPGVDGIGGNRNYIANNTYNNDISRQMVDIGANRPYLKGGKRKQKGGTLSNFMAQDLINLGRQFQFGVGSAYNALAGYAAPVSPLPWKDQFPSRTSLNLSAI